MFAGTNNSTAFKDGQIPVSNKMLGYHLGKHILQRNTSFRETHPSEKHILQRNTSFRETHPSKGYYISHYITMETTPHYITTATTPHYTTTHYHHATLYYQGKVSNIQNNNDNLIIHMVSL